MILCVFLQESMFERTRMAVLQKIDADWVVANEIHGSRTAVTTGFYQHLECAFFELPPVAEGELRVEAVPERELEYLQKQARRCRGAASATLDLQARQTLLDMANEYEQRLEALEREEKRATRMRWDKVYEPMRHSSRVSDVLERVPPEQTGRAVDESGWEEACRRSEPQDVDQAKVRIMQRVARGLPINVFERRLIAGDLPPGLCPRQ